MAATLASLLAPQTANQIFQILLGVYQANGFPTQSWQPGGVERTRLMAISTAIAAVSGTYIPNIAAGGFLDYAPGTGWMPLLAQELYNLLQNAASFTQGTITLTSAAGVGSQTYQPGQLIAVFAASGNRYLNANAITVAAGPGTVSGTFQAEFAGASYNDPSSSGALTLATTIPGVTLTNPASTYSTVAQVGAGTGTLTLGGSPASPHLVVVRIDSTGASGAASWSYSIDGGAYVSAGAVASASNIGGTGINVTLVGALGTSFILNDTYTFNTPGSWITTQGANVETDTALAARCRARWASLSNVAVSNLYYLLATSTPAVGSQVTQCIVVPDANINQKVNIVVAGPAGPLPAGTVSAIQTYINPRAPQGDFPTVVSPTTQAITIVGTVTAFASQLTAAQGAITTALNTYVAGVSINGTVRLSSVIELIMQVPGVIDVSGVTINGSAANLVLGGVGTYVMPAYPPTLTLSYVTQ